MYFFWTLLLTLVGVCLILRNTSLAFYSTWINTDTYSHGLPTLAASIFLLYDNVSKGRVWRFGSEFRLGASLSWLAIAGILGIWFAANVMAVDLVAMLVLPVLACLVVNFALGPVGLAFGWFPIALMLFTVPAWDALNPPLQAITTLIVEQVLGFLKIPNEITGNFVTIPAGKFEIASGCSGLRYVLVTLEFVAIYSYWWLPTWKQRLKLFASAIGLSLLTNWIRVAVIIKVGHDTDLADPLVRDHVGFGWWLYLGAMVLIFFAAERIRGRGGNPLPAAVSEKQEGGYAVNWLKIGAVLLMLSGVSLIEPAIRYFTDPHGSYDLRPPEVLDASFPTPTSMEPPWKPVHERALVNTVLYERAGRTVWYYRALYPWQQHGQELISFDNRLFDETIASARSEAEMTTGEGQPVAVVKLTLSRQRTGILLYWFNVAGFSTNSESAARLYLLPGLLKGRKDGLVSAMYGECVEDCDALKNELLHLADAVD